MKAKGLIVIGAIVMMVIAVGCSNSRTTAPVASNDQFTISSDANNGRFDNSEPTVPVIADYKPIWVFLRGNIIYQGTKCTSIRLANNEYVELNFAANSPERLPQGTEILVMGNYPITGELHCNIYKLFRVTTLTVVGQGDNHTDE
jgi:hypothetical protein